MLCTNQPAKLEVIKVVKNDETLLVRQVLLVEVQATILSGSALPDIRVWKEGEYRGESVEEKGEGYGGIAGR